MSKTIIPSFIISIKNFANNATVAYGNMISKRWTPQMLDLLTPVARNDKGVKFYSVDDIYRVAQTPEWNALLQKKIRKLLVNGTVKPVTEAFLQETCEAMFNVNKHVKAKKFTAASVKKAYEMKAYLLWRLYKLGYVTRIVLEQETNFYRFQILVNGRTYDWHQPPNQMGHYKFTETTVVNRTQVNDGIITNNDHEQALAQLEQAILSLLYVDLEG